MHSERYIRIYNNNNNIELNCTLDFSEFEKKIIKQNNLLIFRLPLITQALTGVHSSRLGSLRLVVLSLLNHRQEIGIDLP